MPNFCARLLFLLLVSVTLLPQNETVNPVVEKFHALLHALEKSLSYSVAHYHEMNFDGVFGLWVAKGYLKYLLSTTGLWRDNFGNAVLVPIRNNLTRLLSVVENAAPDVVQSLKQRDTEYFARMGQLFALRWFPHEPNSLYEISSSVDDWSYDTSFDEQLSDRCISQLLLTNHSSRRCQPSPECQNILTSNPAHGYELTHQVLFTAILLELECTSSIIDLLEPKGMSLFSLSINLCSNTFRELLSLLDLKVLTPKHRDLLMEQIFVCSHIGFLRFNQLPLLDLILSWQHSSGCFTDKPEEARAVNTNLVDRRLAEEHRLPDGCLSHLTSVATAALVTFLRRFLVQTSESSQSELDLYQFILAKEILDRNPYIPALLQPPQDYAMPPMDPSSWRPVVSDYRLSELTQFHHITLQRSFRHIWTQSDLNVRTAPRIDQKTDMLFFCFSLCLLVTCVLFCLRFRRRMSRCGGECV